MAEQNAIILSATNFNDEENPTITYQNTAGEAASLLQACISLSHTTDSAEIAYRDIPKTGSTYTFNLTDAERKILRANTQSASRVVYFYIKSTVNGVTETKKLSSSLTLINAKPTINPVLKDTNARTVEITGDNTIFIRGYSNVYYEIGAEAHKEAQLGTCYILNGKQTSYAKSGTLDKITSNTFYFYARDSRGNETHKAVTRTIIDYIPLTVHLNIDSLSANGDLTFTISGNYYNGSFGKTNNTLELEVGLIENDGDIVWTKLGFINPTIDDFFNRYEYTTTIRGLNYLSNYELIVNVIDELTPAQTASQVASSMPVFDWGKDDFKVNVPLVVRNDVSFTADDMGGGLYYQRQNGSIADLISVRDDYVSINAQNSIDGIGALSISAPELYLQGRQYGENKVLWSGAYYMNAAQSITLNEAISHQPNGIVLVFSLYRNGMAENVSINSFFVSKYEVAALPNAPHSFFMLINSGFSTVGAKYLYIDDTKITGHATNAAAATNNGFNYSNGSFVLRYVIGV